jgi:hypothetical protein
MYSCAWHYTFLQHLRPTWVYHALLGAVVLLALSLRLWAIGWGLPYADNYHDEQTIACVILGMIARRELA